MDVLLFDGRHLDLELVPLVLDGTQDLAAVTVAQEHLPVVDQNNTVCDYDEFNTPNNLRKRKR